MTAPAGFLPNLEVRVIAFSLRDERLHVLLTPEGSLWALPGSRVEAQRSLEEAASGRLYLADRPARDVPGSSSTPLVSRSVIPLAAGIRGVFRPGARRIPNQPGRNHSAYRYGR